jgi:hypothetical protein
MKKGILIFALMLFGIGANAQKTTVKFHDTQARALETTTSSHVKPLVVEVEVSPAKFTDEWPLSDEDVKGMNGDVSNLRSWATFQSAKKHNADVIVAPMYEIKNDEKTGIYSVTVVGYEGRFKNWRSINSTDYDWVRLENVFKTSDREKVEAIVKNK